MSNEQKHTAEPWVVVHNRNTFEVLANDSGVIVARMPEWGVAADKPDAREANARRVVACVNACADIPTEELEQKGTIQNADKLLDASKAALDWIRSQNGVPAAMQDRLYEAIAEIEAAK